MKWNEMNNKAVSENSRSKTTWGSVTAIRAAAMLAVVLLYLGTVNAAMAQNPGSIYTTNLDCLGVNINIFGAKSDVYLNGGPNSTNSPGLPDGYYYVKVTAPDGTLLGTSVPNTPVHVTNGRFDLCYQLSAILIKASDGVTSGYDDSPNGGGVYKVWVSQDATFAGGTTKTDNFKVASCTGDDCGGGEPTPATLNVTKFYDANANGINDDGQPLAGWQVRIQDIIDITRYTPASVVVAPDIYTVTESNPLQSNWVHTTLNPVIVTLAEGDTTTVSFGNVCLGAGGGLTLGFWSNRNGQAFVGATDLAMLVGLNLRNSSGSDFNPTSYADLRTWLLNGTAVNMSYMLSVQLAAMELNVFNGLVSGNSLVYAPGLTPSGFISVNDLMSAANTELGLHSAVFSGNPNRPYQELLKNALDKANNNLNFVKATACPYTFSTQ